MISTKKISIKTGPPVEKEDFYGRERELEYAWLHLQKNSLLLSAPRRVGKSSFSKKMLQLAEESGWKVLYIDLQGIGSEEQFVKLFINKLKSEKKWDVFEGTFSKLIKTIDEIEVAGVKLNLNIWRSSVYDQLRDLMENSGEILIVIDELGIYLNNLLKQNAGREKVEFFLNWLRGFRQLSETRIRWIFCSSIGIENFAAMHQLSHTINDVHGFPIGAFTEKEAKEFISRLDVDESVEFDAESIQYILNKLSWLLPFFIQILVEKINFLIMVEGKNLCETTIDTAYERLLSEKHFNTWDERLKEYRESETYARRVLKLCTVLEGRSRSDLFANLFLHSEDIEKDETSLAKLLAILQNDGYLMESGGKYIFRSPLLRDFWHKRFIL